MPLGAVSSGCHAPAPMRKSASAAVTSSASVVKRRARRVRRTSMRGSRSDAGGGDEGKDAAMVAMGIASTGVVIEIIRARGGETFSSS